MGADFRADLGYMPKADIKIDQAVLERTFYSEQDSIWQEARVSGEWKIIHNTNNELIERELTAGFAIDGSLQSILELYLIHSEKVGLRHDHNNSNIDNNTTSFNENQFKLYYSANINNRTYISLDMALGDKIDYAHNRLGDLTEATGNITVFVTDHLEVDFYQTYSKLNAQNNNKDINVYKANISELRLSYQFDIQSYLKLSLIYNDVDYFNDEHIKDLSSQLIYAYKLNPQTVFFLGYSDNSYQDNDLTKLTRAEKTFLQKLAMLFRCKHIHLIIHAFSNYKCVNYLKPLNIKHLFILY